MFDDHYRSVGFFLDLIDQLDRLFSGCRIQIGKRFIK